jgi:voltage-gated potassium channel
MKNQVRFLAFLLLVSFVTTTWVFWYFEQGENPRIEGFFDVFWWWVVTSTTVGYGDVFPITVAGRFAGMVAIIVGIYIYTNFITLTADFVKERMDRHKLGTEQVIAKNHVVICEYTAFADELLQVIKDYPELAQREVVVVSDLVGVNPYPQYYFVRGVPISPTALAQANIQEADYIFVFSNARFQEPDLKTLHTVSRIQKLNKHATLFVEMHKAQSEFIDYLSGPIVVLRSQDLLASVLRHKPFDLTQFFAASDSAASSPTSQEALSAS